MSALSRFEQFVESVVEGSFARLMRSQLQPVEIAKRLARAMEGERSIAAGKTIVPNEYQVSLSPEDYRYYEQSRTSWEREFAEYLSGIARERGLALFGQPIVVLELSNDVPPRRVRIASRLVDQRASAAPAQAPAELAHTQHLDTAAVRQAAALVPQETRLVLTGGPPGSLVFPVGKPVILIGRALDNDVVLEDIRVSRYHAEVRLRGDRFFLRDLKSTNGTHLNSETVVESALSDGDRISLGGVELVFRIGP